MANSSFGKVELFNNPRFSDATLKIITSQHEASWPDSHQKKKQKTDTGHSKELIFNISSCVLALHSEFFRYSIVVHRGYIFMFPPKLPNSVVESSLPKSWPKFC